MTVAYVGDRIGPPYCNRIEKSGRRNLRHESYCDGGRGQGSLGMPVYVLKDPALVYQQATMDMKARLRAHALVSATYEYSRRAICPQMRGLETLLSAYMSDMHNRGASLCCMRKTSAVNTRSAGRKRPWCPASHSRAVDIICRTVYRSLGYV